MADLREYRYTVNGATLTAMLSETDAKHLGAVLVASPTHEPVVPADDAKARPVQDKARHHAPDKGR